VRNRWLKPVLASVILFAVVALIVIGCSMKRRALASVSANRSAGKSAQQTVSQKHRTEHRRASVHDSMKPCDAASVVTEQSGTPTLQEDGVSARALAQAEEATDTSQAVTPSIIRVLVTVETDKQPDPALRLFHSPAQPGRRPPDSGWQHFRPQAGR
jgi:hypothetical protein